MSLHIRTYVSPHPHPTLPFVQLFDFDIEVRPLLEVLVGKTVEQALMEVMEEEELAALRRQQVGGAGVKDHVQTYRLHWLTADTAM